MKKIILFFCAALIAGIFSGCQSRPDDSSSAKGEDVWATVNTENHEKYSTQNPAGSEFNKTISENEIDKEYLKEIQNAVTTAEMVEVEDKYINLWKAEMQEQLDYLLGKLSAEDSSALSAAQADWERYLSSDAKADRLIFTNDEGVNSFGTSFEYTSRSNIRQMCRERTIHLSYLSYLIDKGY